MTQANKIRARVSVPNTSPNGRRGHHLQTSDDLLRILRRRSATCPSSRFKVVTATVEAHAAPNNPGLAMLRFEVCPDREDNNDQSTNPDELAQIVQDTLLCATGDDPRSSVQIVPENNFN